MELIDYKQTAKAEDKDRRNGIMFSPPIVFQENIAPFLIARDINEPFRWFVSDDFKSICNKNRLRVKFIK